MGKVIIKKTHSCKEIWKYGGNVFDWFPMNWEILPEVGDVLKFFSQDFAWQYFSRFLKTQDWVSHEWQYFAAENWILYLNQFID